MKISDIIAEKARITQGKDSKEVAYLQQAADFLTDYLGLEGHDIIISVDPPRDLDSSQTGVTIGIGKNPRKIFIMIDADISTGEKLQTLAHEFIHAKQLSKGELIIHGLENGKISGEWQGKQFDNIKYSRSNPWEIEAHTKDKQLQRVILDKLGNFKS